MQATTEQAVTGITKSSQGTGPNPEDFSRILLNGKVPIEQNWQQYCTKKRTLTEDRLNGHNVGNACGPASNCIVLDVDDIEAFQAACERKGWTVPATFTVQTGSGKPHYYYQYPQDGSDYGNRTCKPLGFDIRGKGGQVVAPGSIHPDTGKAYRVVKNIPLAPAPTWLLNLYKKDSQQAKAPLIGVPNRYGATALAKELTTLYCTQKGCRNDQLNRSAHALGQLVAGGELEQYKVEKALTAAALGVGLSLNEAKATITSGLSSGMTSPRKAPETIPAKNQNASTVPQKKNSPKKSAVHLVPASQIRPEPVSWIWVGYIARGKVHIIAGPPGHGKTTLLLGLLAIGTIGGRWWWKLPEEFTEDPIHLGVNSSGQNHTQVTDSVEEFTKNSSHEFFGLSGGCVNSSQSVNSSLKSNEEFKAMNSSDEPLTGKGLGVVETSKAPCSTVRSSSESVGVFGQDDEAQQSDLWEVEI